MPGPVSIRWAAHPELSAVHASYVVATGARCIDPKTEQVLVGPVTDINTRLLSSSIDVGKFWQRLHYETAFSANQRGVCEIALAAAGCSELQVEQTTSAITNRIRDCRLAFNTRFPKLSEQLELRSRPLKDRWDTVGSGLLNDVAKQIWSDNPPSDWWPPRVQCALVQPMRGGDGGFDPHSNQFWIEAMLTDADPSVGEVIRVAWLVTNIAIEQYTRDKSGEHSLAMAWSLASIPLVLKAAARLDLIRDDTLPIQTAIQLWNAGDKSDAVALEQWWQQFQASEMPWPIALKALNQMLERSQSFNTRGGVQAFDVD